MGLFLIPFFMKYRVKILKTIKAEDTKVGVEAIVKLRCASKQMINLLRRKYLEDNNCLIGDVKFLFSFNGIGLGKDDYLFKP